MARGNLYSLLASLLWGATGLWMYYLRELSLESVLFFRFLVSLLFIALIAVFLKSHIVGRNADFLGGIALCSYYCFATTAFVSANMIDVGFIISTTPFFVMLWWWLKGRPPNGLQLAGAMLATIGTLLVIAGAEPAVMTGVSNSTPGLLFAFGAALSMTLYSVISASAGTSAITVNLWAFLIGLLASMLLFSASHGFSLAVPFMPSVEQVLLLMGLALLSTLGAGMIYKFACQLSGPVTASIIRLSTPLFTALLSWLFIGKGLSMLQGIGSPFILAGIYLVISQSKHLDNVGNQ